MIRFLSLLLLITISQLSISQSADYGTLSGRVLVEDQEPAAYATAVAYSSVEKEMIKAGNTDMDGNFALPLPSGTYILEISYVGYADLQSATITMAKGEQKNIGDLQLITASEELSEVVVKAKRPMIEIKPDKTVFNVAGSINAQGGNALELLRKAPGVILDNNESILLLGKTGVIVYIDGKPSPLSAADLANYLKGLSASTIDNIEIITNPSSKYEAEGNAGIINIRLKKSENVGTNVSLTTGVATNSKVTSYDGGLQINNRGIKSNIFGSYNYSKNENQQEMFFMRTIASTLYDQDAVVSEERTNHNAKIGVDYFVNEKSTVGVLINAFVNDGQDLNTSHSDIFLDNNTNYVDSILNAQNNISRERENYSFNVNYAFNNKKGRTVNIDLDYGLYSGLEASDQPNDYLDGQSKVLVKNVHFGSDAQRDIDIYTFKTDVEQPAWKGTLGYGIKLALVKTDNDFQFFNVINDGQRALDLDRSNRFLYDENVNAAYVNFQRGNDTWNYQLGLRVENTASSGELQPMNGTVGQTNKRDYTDFFPSAGITYNMNQKNTFRLTYSRRLNRPNYQDLNPFEFKLDELAFQKGNPFLNPEYTNNFQLGHTFNYTLNTTFSYSRTEDMITRITDTEDGRQAFITWENLASQDALSLSISYPYSPTKWWSTYFNVSGNYINNKSQDGDSRFTADRNVDVEATFVSIFGQNTIQLPKDINLEISGFYNSPGIWGGNFETDEYWNIDVGLQKKFLDNKLSVKIGVSDIFWGQQWHATNNFGPLSIDARGRNQTRRFKLNLSYNFGNEKVRSRRRATGLEDERKRTNSSGGL